jgi:chromosome segregation ATPase
MAENENTPQPDNAPAENAAEEQRRKGITRPFNTDDVPEYRLEELNRKKKEAEQRAKDAEARLRQIESEREQQQEERAQQQGQYQEIAEKRQKKIEKLEAELKQTREAWTEERRRNTWNRAAQGVVKPTAVQDAFLFLSEEDLSGVDDGDEAAFKKLAENLVEVRDYLAADGPRGAGSGGSRHPVLGSEEKPGTRQSARPTQLIPAKRAKRPSWK